MNATPMLPRRARSFFLFLILTVTLATSCGKFAKTDDAAITTDIKAKMFSDPSLKSASVDVSSRGGEVTLTGQVADDSARLAAYKIASEAKGVTKVNDQMTVQSAQAAAAVPASSAAPATDAMNSEPPARETPRRPAKSKSRTSPAGNSGMAGSANGAGAASDSGMASSAPMQQAQQTATPPPQPRTVTVPSGAIITVRTIDPIDSSVNTAGQVFKASLDAPIVVDDHVVVPKGGDVYVKLENAKSAGKISGRSELTLGLQSILFQGKTYNVETSDVSQTGASRGKDSAMKIGGGAVLGALIGGIAGGGKGAAIGAAAGGGAGTGVQVFTKGKQVKIPSETRLDFTLQQPFDITYIPGRRSRASGSQNSAPNASSDQPPSNN
ncbi:MAG TPA: BON domain-containing protein [Candidatus Acidoferrum sp.]|nr:BON domain-containing protein [Candidatus Acidoferrum sp.]